MKIRDKVKFRFCLNEKVLLLSRGLISQLLVRMIKPKMLASPKDKKFEDLR